MAGTRDFEESFSQILSRTRQNIERVNQSFNINSSMYQTSRSTQSLTNPKYGASSQQGARHSSPNRIDRDSYSGNNSNTTPMVSGNWSGRGSPTQSIRSSSGDSKSSVDGLRYHNGSRGNFNSINNDGTMGAGNMISIDAMFFEDIRQRLSNIENRSRVEDTMQQKHIADLEKQQDTLVKQTEEYKSEIRELQRQVVHLTSSLRSQSQALDNLQEETDLKRNSISRLESWYRETESWKSLVDTSITNNSKNLKAIESDLKSSIFNNGSKDSANALMDRIDILTQQRIAATTSVIYDRIDSQVRSLERSIAGIRMQGTPSPDITDSQVKDILSSSFPMETVLKGMISKELRNLEDTVESKLETRLKSAVFNRFYEKENEFKYQIQILIKQISDELGIETVVGDAVSGDDIDSISSSSLSFQALLSPSAATTKSPQASKAALTVKSVIDKRRVSEESVELLSQRVADMSRDLSTVQSNIDELQIGIRGDLSIMERTLSEKTLLAKHWNDEACGAIEQLTQSVKEVETKVFDSVSKTREYFLGHVHDSINAFKGNVTELDKRLAISEIKIEDITKKVSQTFDANSLDAMLANSSLSKRLDTGIHRIDSLTDEVRKFDLNILKLESGSVKLADFTSLKDRIHLHEMSLKQLDDIGLMTRENVKALQSLQTEVKDNQKDYSRFVSETYSTSSNNILEKLSEAEANYLSISHKMSISNHENQLLNARVSKVENEIPGIEELIKTANQENFKKSEFTSFHIKTSSDIQSLKTDTERMAIKVQDFTNQLSKTSNSIAAQVAENTSLINKECTGLTYKFDSLKMFVDDRCNSLHQDVSSLDKRVKNNYELLDYKVESYKNLHSSGHLNQFVTPSDSIIAAAPAAPAAPAATELTINAHTPENAASDSSSVDMVANASSSSIELSSESVDISTSNSINEKINNDISKDSDVVEDFAEFSSSDEETKTSLASIATPSNSSISTATTALLNATPSKEAEDASSRIASDSAPISTNSADNSGPAVADSSTGNITKPEKPKRNNSLTLSSTSKSSEVSSANTSPKPVESNGSASGTPGSASSLSRAEIFKAKFVKSKGGSTPSTPLFNDKDVSNGELPKNEAHETPISLVSEFNSSLTYTPDPITIGSLDISANEYSQQSLDTNNKVDDSIFDVDLSDASSPKNNSTLPTSHHFPVANEEPSTALVPSGWDSESASDAAPSSFGPPTTTRRLSKTVNPEDLEAIASHGIVSNNIKVFEKEKSTDNLQIPAEIQLGTEISPKLPEITTSSVAPSSSSPSADGDAKARRAEAFKAKFGKKK